MMTREEAEKELIAMLEEAEGGPSYSMEEVDAYIRLAASMSYIVGMMSLIMQRRSARW